MWPSLLLSLLLLELSWARPGVRFTAEPTEPPKPIMGIGLAEATPVSALVLGNCVAWVGGTEVSEKDLEDWSRAEKRESERGESERQGCLLRTFSLSPPLLWACFSL